MSAVPVSVVVVAALVVGAFVVTRVSGVVLRRLVRRVAERSIAAGNVTRWWRAGTSRGALDVADGGARRRRQRVDSAARMLNHVVAIVIWLGVTIAVFHVLDVDAAFMLSSAGFIGAGVAFGGQHKVNDYLTGLSVLFEDRYGVGDTIVVEMSGEPVHGVVEHVGLFTTRLRDRDSTLHVPNAGFVMVRNLSQSAYTETLRLHLPDEDAGEVDERSAADAVRQMAGQEHLTEVIFVGDIAAARRGDGDIDVAVQTTRPLGRRERETIVRRAEHSLRGR